MQQPEMPTVYVAAGSNVEPEKHLRLALEGMRAAFGKLLQSRAYRNKAVGFEGADFINLVVGFPSDEPLERVIDRLRAIEAVCGRPRAAPKWAPRSIDLDILLYGDLAQITPEYTLPRPDLLRRPYMLGPLAEIAPQLMHPTAKKTIAQLWTEFDQGAHQLIPVEL